MVPITPDEIDNRFSEFLLGQKKLLKSGKQNKKLSQNTTETFILNLSPAQQNSQGKNLCAYATPGCKAGCLHKAGLGRMPTVIRSRQLTTEVFLKYQEAFCWILYQELKGLNVLAKLQNRQIAIRLNGTSDLDWFQLLKVKIDKEPLLEFSNLIFYNYTKSFKMWEKYKNTSYDLTFSRSETNWLQCQWVLGLNGNVAVVFHKEIPTQYQGYPVYNGDSNDMRWIDPAGHIIGLTFKKVGGVNPLTNNFVVKI